jgi:diguanylate cyclase (GGDEF)-like protein
MTPQSEAAPIEPVPGDRTVRVIEYFVHPALRSNPDLLYRTRVLIGLLLMFAALSVLTTPILALVPLPRLNQILSIGICLFCFLGTCGLLRRLRRHGSYRLCSVAAELLLQATTVISIAASGGIIQSPGSQLLALPPLLAYFFGGVRGGSRSLAFSLFLAAAFVAAEWGGIRFPQTVGTAHELRTARLLACFLDVLIVSAMAFIYELTASKLKAERDREHRKVLALAQRDALTGLANRRCLDDRLSERLNACGSATPPQPFVLCCIDLDGFKPINDRFGHKVGDEVLRTIADRLLLTIRGADVVGRRGGDEFMAIFEVTGTLPDAASSSVEIVAERILSVIGRPIETSVGSLRVGASLGFACHPHDGRDAETLIRAADAVMYEVKCAGGSGWRLFRPPPHAEQVPDKVLHQPAPADTARDGTDASPLTAHAREAAAGPHGKSRVIALLDALVHPALRLEPGIMNRARILATALLLTSVLLALAAVVLALAPLQAESRNLCMTIALVVLAIMVLLQGVLRGTANYVVSSLVTLAILYLVILAAMTITGGAATSCCAQAMAVLPLIAYFFGGARWGNVMAVASLASIVVFALLEMGGLRLDNALDDTTSSLAYLMICMQCLVFTSGIAFAYVFVARNLERQRDMEQKLVERLAQTDALTGLDNRLKFDSELRARIARGGAAAEPRHPFTLCYMDLDGFKPINDRHGHDVGDEVLRAISERLLGCVRAGDPVARYGGDEFALLLNSVENEHEMELAARRLLRAIASPIRTRAGMVSVRGSLGFAMFPFDGDGEDALKNAADKAMYVAKGQGSGWRSFKTSLGAAAPRPLEQACGLTSTLRPDSSASWS